MTTKERAVINGLLNAFNDLLEHEFCVCEDAELPNGTACMACRYSDLLDEAYKVLFPKNRKRKKK